MNNTYYILFTCSEHNDFKINRILTELTKQIEHFSNNIIAKNIKILACKDNIETYKKEEILIKEANSPYYEFLDEEDEVYDTYIQDLILQWSEVKKNAVLTACNSKYFRSCLTLITSLYKHSDNDIDTIYVFDL